MRYFKIVLTLFLGATFTSLAQPDLRSSLRPNNYDYRPSFESDYLGIYYQKTRQIQQLQIEISRKERSIYTTIQQNRFRWFNRWDLIQYHNDIQQAKLEVAQLRWQLSRAMYP